MLLDAAVEVVRSGHSGVMSIVGEAGAGKTRLAEQIVDALENEAIVVRTACAPYGESNVWEPVTTAVYSTFGIEPDSDADAVRQAVEKQAHELWGLETGDAELDWYVDAIGYLMGHPSDLDRLDAAGARDVLTGALTEMMRRSAQTRMTVLWFDNLQWADPMLRDLLAVIVRSLADLPFLLITGQRPDDDIVWPPPVERPLVLRVPLGPIGREDATTLVRGGARARPGGRGAVVRRRCRGRARRPWWREPAVPRRARRPWRRRAARGRSCPDRCAP